MSLCLCAMLVALEDGPDFIFDVGVAAWLVAISRSSCVVRGFWHPSLWTMVLQCIPLRNALMMSASMMPGSELHYLEKRRM